MLFRSLKAAGKDVVCWNQDPLPAKLAFLDPHKLVRNPEGGRSFDCVIATDCASLERLGTTAQHIAKRRLFINIDHHPSNTRYGDVNWVSDKQASTGELIYQLLAAAKWPITRQIADCLFTAVSTDTGSFQYASTKPSTFQTASHLVERGADLGATVLAVRGIDRGTRVAAVTQSDSSNYCKVPAYLDRVWDFGSFWCLNWLSRFASQSCSMAQRYLVVDAVATPEDWQES